MCTWGARDILYLCVIYVGGGRGVFETENRPFLEPKNEKQTFKKPKTESGYSGENRKTTFFYNEKRKTCLYRKPNLEIEGRRNKMITAYRSL